MTEFKEGDVVRLNAPFFSRYHGKRGIVLAQSQLSPYINVRFEMSVGGWHPDSLVLIDTEAEAREVLGDAYFE